jgi:hypothetical protein
MMRRAGIVVLAVVTAVVAGRLGFGEERDEQLSKVLLPPAKPSVGNVHSRCPAVKQDCLICHRPAATSRWASDRLSPFMETCAECHEAARNATPLSPFTDACKACHMSVKAGEMPVPGSYPRPNLRFSHKAHQKAARCKSCHPKAGAYQDAARGEMDVLGMKTCVKCHQKTPCRSCHITRKDGTMVTDYGGRKLYPRTWLKGPSHGPEWAGTHAVQAAADSKFCAACHRETYCQECHAGNRRPRNVHPGDWLTSHGVSTRVDSPRCRGCHRKQSFCLTCHRRSGVAPDSPVKARPDEGLGHYHRGMETRELMRRARRDITSCVSCHNESSCILCHTRFNPHPPDFRRKCKGLAARNRRSCAKCHSSDPTRFCR